jgi:hypothetical protein
MGDNRKMYNKSCDKAFTGLKLRWTRSSGKNCPLIRHGPQRKRKNYEAYTEIVKL